MIVDAIVVVVQVVVPMIENAQGAQAEASGGPEGNGSDPFANKLEAFFDIGVLKFSRDKGPLVAIKWIVHIQRMVYI